MPIPPFEKAPARNITMHRAGPAGGFATSVRKPWVPGETAQGIPIPGVSRRPAGRAAEGRDGRTVLDLNVDLTVAAAPAGVNVLDCVIQLGRMTAHKCDIKDAVVRSGHLRSR